MFRFASDKTVNLIANAMKKETYKKGEVIIEQARARWPPPTRRRTARPHPRAVQFRCAPTGETVGCEVPFSHDGLERRIHGEVCSFVREIGLAQHEPVASAFQRHGVSGALLLSLTRAELGELLGDATAIADRRQLAAKIADLRWASSRRAAVLRALRRLWPGWLFARFWPWRAKPKRE